MVDPCAQLGLAQLVATEPPHTEEVQLADSKAEVAAGAVVTGVECNIYRRKHWHFPARKSPRNASSFFSTKPLFLKIKKMFENIFKI